MKSKDVPVRLREGVSGRTWTGVGYFAPGEVRAVPADIRRAMLDTGYFVVPASGAASAAVEPDDEEETKK